jgi:L,D-transpeptidase catalytic domain
MRIRHLAVALAFSALAAAPARADLLIQIDKAKQQMTVTADGEQLYAWAVSTGRAGYNTPGGAFKPNRMDKDHYSEEWDDAPMPYSIFFDEEGHAIHGTYEVKHLGQPVSHGCVRLSVKNAAILWGLVKHYKMANTRVELSGEIADRTAATGSIVREETAADDPPPRKRARHRSWRDDGSSYTYYRYEPPRRRYYRYSAPFPFGW